MVARTQPRQFEEWHGSPHPDRPRARPAGAPVARGRRTRRRRVLAALVAAAVVAVVASFAASGTNPVDAFGGTSTTPLQSRIVSIAESQLGYRADPPDTYCNQYSAYWHTGTDDCGNGNLDEQWCADFAAWVWQKAGAVVVYRDRPGDLNAASASFYLWGMNHGTWHDAGSGYTPQPGDVAVYGLDKTSLVAQHVAVVTGYVPGARGPDVVNGNGSRTAFSIVEPGHDQFDADVHGSGGRISGYVSPTAPGGG